MATRKERWTRKAPEAPPPPLPKAAPFDWRPHLYAVLTVWALLLAAYANSFQGGLIYDAKIVVEDDPRIRVASGQNVGQIWTGGYWYDNSDPTLYRPLSTLSYLLNYAVLGNGNSPAGYHAVNLLLHACNALLVYIIGFLLFRRILPSAALAALWAVHPVLTESVTNVVGRADLLSGFGVLAGFLCHVTAISSGRRKAPWLLGLLFASGLAIFSKESGIVLIALMLLYDLGFRRSSLSACVPGYIAAVFPVLFYFYERSQVLARLPVGVNNFLSNPLFGAGFVSSRLTAIEVIGRYLLRILWPLHLSGDYSYNQIPVVGSGSAAQYAGVVLALVACLGLAALAMLWYRREAPGFFFIALFFVALAPVANIAMRIGTIMAERFLYLPAIGLIGAIVFALYSASPQAESRITAVLGVVCLALVVRTAVRNTDWRTMYSLFRSAAEVSPGSYRVHNNLSVAWFRERGDIDRAIAEGETALAILKPLPPEIDDDGIMYSSMGVLYRDKGDRVAKSSAADARQWYEKSEQTLLRGIKIDQVRSAESARENDAAGKPRVIFGNYRLYLELARVYLRFGQPDRAIENLNAALYYQQNGEVFQTLSQAQRAAGRPDDAAVALMEELVIHPDQPAFASDLVKLYEETQPQGCAVQHSSGSASLNIACAAVHGHLCAATDRVREIYARRGQAAEAEKVRATAIQSFGCPSAPQ